MNKVTFFLLFLFQISFCQTSKPHDTLFVRLKDYSNQFEYDLRYATENNFLNAKVYDCAECYLRYKTVKKLIEAYKNERDDVTIFRYKALYKKEIANKELQIYLNNQNQVSAIKSLDWSDSSISN